MDVSPYGRFAPWTFRPALDISPHGRFAHRGFAPWTWGETSMWRTANGAKSPDTEPKTPCIRLGADPPVERGHFRGLSGPGDIQKCRQSSLQSSPPLRCKRNHSISNNVMQQKGSFSVPDNLANRNPKNYKRRQCGLSAGKGVVRVHSAGEV